MLAVIQEVSSSGLASMPMAVWVVAGTLVATAMLKKSGASLPIIGDNPKYAAWAAGILLHFAMRVLGLGDGDIQAASDLVAGAMSALTAQVIYKHGGGDILKALKIDA